MNVLVFGGTGWIGSEVCRLLYKEGCNIIFTYYENKNGALELENSLEGCSRKAKGK